MEYLQRLIPIREILKSLLIRDSILTVILRLNSCERYTIVTFSNRV